MTARSNFPMQADKSLSDKTFFRPFTWQSRHLHYRGSLGREEFLCFTFLTDTSLDKPSFLKVFWQMGVLAFKAPNLGNIKTAPSFHPLDQNMCTFKLFNKDNICNISSRMTFSPKSKVN